MSQTKPLASNYTFAFFSHHLHLNHFLKNNAIFYAAGAFANIFVLYIFSYNQ